LAEKYFPFECRFAYGWIVIKVKYLVIESPKEQQMRYSLLLNSYEAEPGAIDPEMAKQFMAAFDLYAKDLEKAGVLVAAEVLQPSAHSTTLTLRHGHLQIQDGPFADTKEQLAGIFVIDVADMDQALKWAEQCPGAQYGVMEIRPAATAYIAGQWQSFL
jgi:hypothetical protein